MISLQEGRLRLVICDDVKPEEGPILVEAVRAQHRYCGQKLYYLSVIPEAAPMPDSAVRKSIIDGLRAIHDYCQYSALVFCGDGLPAVMKRTAFSGMLMLIMKGKWHVAKSVDELVRNASSDPMCVEELRRAVRLAAALGYRL
jgi:hypothetical protein